MNSLLITGINGFIGQALVKKMMSKNWRVRGTVRKMNYNTKIVSGLDVLKVESMGPNTNWSEALIGVDCVIHLAAHVHIFKKKTHDSLSLFRKINTEGTENLAREAALANVKRFIFMSSVKVNGEGRSTAYNEEDIPQPQDAYGISKWEAEKVLNKISEETGMEIVILRSPLVYGPWVKANFLRLLNLVAQGIPLPLASVKNQRSLIYIENLVDAVVSCINHPKAPGQTYFVSDGEDVSTPELIRRIGLVLGKPARLFPFPAFMLKLAWIITLKSIAMDRLFCSLTVDCSKIHRELEWQPPFYMEQGLRETAKWYLKKDAQFF